MNPRAFALVVLKFFGVYLLFVGVTGLVFLLQVRGRGTSSSDGGGLLLPAVLGLVGLAIGILLLFHTGWVVRRMFRDADFEAVGPAAVDIDFLATGLALIGAWLLAQSIPALVSRGTVVLGLVVGDHQVRFQEWWRENYFDMVYFGAELLIGLVLFTRNRKLAKIASAESSPT